MNKTKIAISGIGAVGGYYGGLLAARYKDSEDIDIYFISRGENRIRADDRSQLNYILLQVVAFGTAKQVIDWSYFSRIVGCEGWFCFDRQECIFDFDAVLTYLFQVFTPGRVEKFTIKDRMFGNSFCMRSAISAPFSRGMITVLGPMIGVS